MHVPHTEATRHRLDAYPRQILNKERNFYFTALLVPFKPDTSQLCGLQTISFAELLIFHCARA